LHQILWSVNVKSTVLQCVKGCFIVFQNFTEEYSFDLENYNVNLMILALLYVCVLPEFLLFYSEPRKVKNWTAIGVREKCYSNVGWLEFVVLFFTW